MKYRVKYKDGYFYPQYKFLWFYLTFTNTNIYGMCKKVKYTSLDEAKSAITRYLIDNKETSERGTRYYEYK